MEAVIKVGKKTFAKNDYVQVTTKNKNIFFGKINCIYDISSGGRPYFGVLPERPLAESICVDFEDVETIKKYKKGR